jgi:hypothetical protein
MAKVAPIADENDRQDEAIVNETPALRLAAEDDAKPSQPDVTKEPSITSNEDEQVEKVATNERLSEVVAARNKAGKRTSRYSNAFGHTLSQQSVWSYSRISGASMAAEETSSQVKHRARCPPVVVKALARILESRVFSAMIMISIAIALVLPDLFEASQVATSMPLDIILCIVFVVFAVEWVGLICVDKNYPFSFFFWMDLIGTVTLIIDISFMLGPSASEPYSQIVGDKSQVDGNRGAVIARASRATRLGARAGRLSRVLKIVRFILPLLNSGSFVKLDERVEMAKVISFALNNALSVRVAFLTICVVVAVPTLNLFTHPEFDDSMVTWTMLMNRHADLFREAYDSNNVTSANEQKVRLISTAKELSVFYDDKDYGPFEICYGKLVDTEMHCQNQVLDLQKDFESIFSAPSRKRSVRVFKASSFQVNFDMHQTERAMAISTILLLIFVIVVMMTFALIVSNSIDVIALHPLEKILSVVRDRCAEIFKFTSLLDDMDIEKDRKTKASIPDSEDPSAGMASEFVLLELAVKKLANVAALTQKNEIKCETEEEKMQLAWNGTVTLPKTTVHDTATLHPPSDTTACSSETILGEDGKSSEKSIETNMWESVTDQIDIETLDGLRTAKLNTLAMVNQAKTAVSIYLLIEADGHWGQWVRQNVPEKSIVQFVNVLESNYQDNSFHNWAHGVDVTYTLSYFMALIHGKEFLTDVQMFSIKVAALAHDVGHFGVGNPYLIETGQELAVKYNDRSPLENMHCSKLFEILSDPETNLFKNLPIDVYKTARQGMIQAILHTDLIKHNEMLKEMGLLYQLNSDVCDAKNVKTLLQESPQNTQMVISAMLHLADVNNPMKPFEICKQWAYNMLEEFFAQGDLERAAGIPVNLLNDRDTVNKPNSQIGFIDFYICPYVEVMVNVFPELDSLAINLRDNIERWAALWKEESKPPADAVAKTDARIQKIAARCNDATREARSIA